MHRNFSPRKKAARILITILSINILITLTSGVSAVPIAITSLEPDIGSAGTIVNIIGAIDTLGGSYEIWWDNETLLAEGTSPSGSTVVAESFIVPFSSEDIHNVYLVDITTGTPSDPWPFFFSFNPSYSLSMEPDRIQEGHNTSFTIGVQGAAPNQNFTFASTVTTPTIASYTINLTVTTDEVGSGAVSEDFWGGFLNANTDFIGTYSVAINESVAAGNFSVGLTNKLVYGVSEIVHIRGSGYNPNENVVVNITFDEASLPGYPKSITADNAGVVIDSWSIPIDAAGGTYLVTLVSISTPGTMKELVDAQEFNVLPVLRIQTRNLEDKPVADVSVEVYDSATNNLLITEKTNKTGWAQFLLEAGNYTFRAFWKEMQVGSLSTQSAPGPSTRILECQLAHIKIVVIDEENVVLPLINVTLSYNYTTRNNIVVPKTFQQETNFLGIAEATNLFTGINYTVEARRYGYLFNRTHIENLGSSLEINISSPTITLFVQVLDSKGSSLEYIQVQVYEWSSGLTGSVGEGTTNDIGSISFTLPFGKYEVRVSNYSSELGYRVLLNETVVDLIDDPTFTVIHCQIFDLTLLVQVIDYFGQPIPNAEVRVEREIEQEYAEIISLTTASNGSVRLPKIGGDYRLSISVLEKLYETRTLHLIEPKTIKFKIDALIVVGGFSIQTSQFIGGIAIGLLIILVIVILLFRRFRVRRHAEEKQ